MTDQVAQLMMPGRGRSAFVRLPEQSTTPRARTRTLQRTHGGVNFWGQADIKNSVVGAGALTLKLGTDYQDYLDQVANVFSTWRNQYILGSASAKESPFVPPGAAALIQR